MQIAVPRLVAAANPVVLPIVDVADDGLRFGGGKGSGKIDGGVDRDLDPAIEVAIRETMEAVGSNIEPGPVDDALHRRLRRIPAALADAGVLAGRLEHRARRLDQGAIVELPAVLSEGCVSLLVAENGLPLSPAADQIAATDVLLRPG